MSKQRQATMGKRTPGERPTYAVRGRRGWVYVTIGDQTVTIAHNRANAPHRAGLAIELTAAPQGHYVINRAA